MGKVKFKHNSNFTIINNTIFQDKTISAKAKGLFATMCSLPENWDFNIAGLTALSTDGEVAVSSGLRELEDRGYLKRERVRENGKVVDIDYTLFEMPDLNQENLNRENLDVENLEQENQAQLSTKEIKNKKNKNTKPVYGEYGQYKNVLLTDEQLEKLKDEFPQDWQERIDRVDGYVQSTGKKYRDYLATIRNWARKDGQRNMYRKNTYHDNLEKRVYEDEEHTLREEYKRLFQSMLPDERPDFDVWRKNR